MTRLLPNSTLHRYAGGHLAQLTEPDQLAPIIDRFLDHKRTDHKRTDPNRSGDGARRR